MPSDEAVVRRLEMSERLSTSQIAHKLMEYHRTMEDVYIKYDKICRVFNADQSKDSVFTQGL